MGPSSLGSLAELASKPAQDPAATDLAREEPRNPLPSAFDSASSTADLYGFTSQASRGTAPDAATTTADIAATAPPAATHSWNETVTDADSTAPAPSHQRPGMNRTSSANYQAALATRSKREGDAGAGASGGPPSPMDAKARPVLDTAAAQAAETGGALNPPLGSPTSATWRPTMFREHSWSMQDQRRQRHGELVGPLDAKRPGSRGYTAAAEHKGDARPERVEE